MELVLSSQEFMLIKRFIEDQCGISIGEDKAYLVESRLSSLLLESGKKRFDDFYRQLVSQADPALVEKTIDAITTNETFWFRDSTPWLVLEELLLPAFIESIRKGKKTKIRIWSAACSTGQEPYSIAMLIDRFLIKKGITDIGLSDFEILASDISCSALDAAKTGNYDNISILRGLKDEYKESYFTNRELVWAISDRIKRAIEFRKLNLCKDFSQLGSFDIIFCRYVTIYFSEKLKREVMDKMARALKPGGVLFIGSSELFGDSVENFTTEQYKNGVFYKLKE